MVAHPCKAVPPIMNANGLTTEAPVVHVAKAKLRHVDRLARGHKFFDTRVFSSNSILATNPDTVTWLQDHIQFADVDPNPLIFQVRPGIFPSDDTLSSSRPRRVKRSWRWVDNNQSIHIRSSFYSTVTLCCPRQVPVAFIPGVEQLFSRTGRAHPRIVVSRKPPGSRRLDLSPIQPIERIVFAKRRAFPVV
jgi:hypothetical protein